MIGTPVFGKPQAGILGGYCFWDWGLIDEIFEHIVTKKRFFRVLYANSKVRYLTTEEVLTAHNTAPGANDSSEDQKKAGVRLMRQAHAHSGWWEEALRLGCSAKESSAPQTRIQVLHNVARERYLGVAECDDELEKWRNRQKWEVDVVAAKREELSLLNETDYQARRVGDKSLMSKTEHQAVYGEWEEDCDEDEEETETEEQEEEEEEEEVKESEGEERETSSDEDNTEDEEQLTPDQLHQRTMRLNVSLNILRHSQSRLEHYRDDVRKKASSTQRLKRQVAAVSSWADEAMAQNCDILVTKHGLEAASLASWATIGPNIDWDDRKGASLLSCKGFLSYLEEFTLSEDAQGITKGTGGELL